MTTRKYSSRSQQTTLSAALTSSDTSATVVSGTGLLGGVTVSAGEIFTVVIDPDTALEEIVDVSATSGSTLTITRGVDGSTAQAHSAGAVVRHMAIGRDYREANAHIENTTTAHGLTLADVVKTTDTGTVTSTMIANGTIVNADVNTSAAIAYSKLNLAGSITTSDIANNTILDADINASAGIALSKLATDPLARANHTGTQTASTISDFNTAVRTNRLDQMAAPTAAVSANSQKITDLATPTVSADAANKSYVDTQIASLIDGAPTTLDTLNEIAAAINDTANFADTVVLKTGSTMSGNLAMGTNKVTGLGTPTTSTDAATKGYVDTVTVAPSNLTGPITSVGAATAIASQTGTGTKFVMDTSPTLVTPVLGVATATSINGTTIPTSKTLVATDSTAYVVPSQSGNSGKYLTTNGTVSSWGVVDALPSQTGNSGKYLTTNGSAASWATITTDPVPQILMLGGM